MNEILNEIGLKDNRKWMQKEYLCVPGDHLVWFYSSENLHPAPLWLESGNPKQIDLPAGHKACWLPRDVDFSADYSVTFADGVEGVATLVIRARILEMEPGQSHPLLGRIAFDFQAGEADIRRDVARLLAAPFMPCVAQYFASAAYGARRWPEKELRRIWEAQADGWNQTHGLWLRDVPDSLRVEQVSSPEGERRLRDVLEAEKQLREAQTQSDRNKILDEIRAQARLSELQMNKLVRLAEQEIQFEIEQQALLEKGKLEALEDRQNLERLEREVDQRRQETILEIIELDARLTREQKEQAAMLWRQSQQETMQWRKAMLQNRLEIAQEKKKRTQLQNELLAKKIAQTNQSAQHEEQMRRFMDRLAGQASQWDDRFVRLLRSAETMADAANILPSSLTQALEKLDATIQDLKAPGPIRAVFQPEIKWSSYHYRDCRPGGEGEIVPDREICPNFCRLSSGQALQVELRASQDCWFYIFNLGKCLHFQSGQTSYEWTLLFGNDGANEVGYHFSRLGGNALQAGEWLRLPQDGGVTRWRDQFWPLDNNPGTEVMFVVFAAAPLPEEQLIHLKHTVPQPAPMLTRGILHAKEKWSATGSPSAMPTAGSSLEYPLQGEKILRECLNPLLGLHRVTFYHI